jgi:putative transposase
MTDRDDEAAARTERARAIGLFWYRLIREVADPALSLKARGRLVRQIAAEQHLDPSGRLVRVSRDTLDRWIRVPWRTVGLDALVPSPRRLRSGFSAGLTGICSARSEIEGLFPGSGWRRRSRFPQTFAKCNKYLRGECCVLRLWI